MILMSFSYYNVFTAPGSGLAAERYLGQAKAVVDFSPGPDQDGFVPLKVIVQAIVKLFLCSKCFYIL